MSSRAPGRVRTALALCLLGVATALPAAALAHTSDTAAGGQPISSSISADEMIATRQRFFGEQNVHPRTGAVRGDRLILAWSGVTNFAMAIRGHVVLLDAWVPRGAHSGYVPTSPAELAKLRPEAIFIGHAHFDHAADAVPIALATGAPLIGTAEHCSEFRDRPGGDRTRCLAAVPAGVAPGTTKRPDVLRRVDIRAVKNLHSAVTAPDGSDGYHVPVTPLPSTTALANPPTPEDLLQVLGGLPDAEGGSVLYRFAVGNFSFVWNDSAGPLSDQAPGGLAALRALRPVDLHVGAIQGFNQFTNGLRDPRQYIEALSARTFVPAHHDDWAIGITTRGAAYEAPFMEELERVPDRHTPDVHFIFDPADYVDPAELSFGLPARRPRLKVECGARGRPTARLARDLGRFRSVRFKTDGDRVRFDRRSPYRVGLDRLARGSGERVRVNAKAELLNGKTRRLTAAAACS